MVSGSPVCLIVAVEGAAVGDPFRPTLKACPNLSQTGLGESTSFGGLNEVAQNGGPALMQQPQQQQQNVSQCVSGLHKAGAPIPDRGQCRDEEDSPGTKRVLTAGVASPVVPMRDPLEVGVVQSDQAVEPNRTPHVSASLHRLSLIHI